MIQGRVLVTGASGLVGTRVCEHLRLGRALEVRGAVHDPQRAVRLARLDVERAAIDLADPASLERALDGCAAVVHCAYGTTGTPRTRRRLTGEATATLAELARRAGVTRFVHLSSTAVWGFAADRELDESVPTEKTGHPYTDGKIESEQRLAEVAARGLATVVLRPTNVFGPWAPAFTASPAAAIRDGAVALVGDGTTPANQIYVDNLVHAIVRALESDDAVGGTFVVSDPEPVTWRELLEGYARASSPPREVRSLAADRYRELRPRRSRVRDALLTAAEYPALRALGRRVPGVRTQARRIADTGGGALPSEELASLQLSRTRYRLDRARDLLGYAPPVAFDEAMRITGEWLRFARLA